MEDVIKLIRKQPDLYVMKGASDNEIKQLEQVLGLGFAADYRKYLAIFGAVSFANHEFTGVCKSKRLNVGDVTIKERSITPVPNDWYVLEETNVDGIVIWQDSKGKIYQSSPSKMPIQIADSLEDYVRNC